MTSSKVRDSRLPTARRGRLSPDPELWQALGGAEGLRAVLQDFYAKVFADPRLAPFFEGVRKEFVIDKQFSFLRSILTGSRDYFGNHPRRAHSWMLISDELFDHRENLLEESLLSHGVDRETARRARELDEVFRQAIVKDRPLRRMSRGREVPLERFDVAVLEVGTLCDGCEQELSAGDRVVYHLRTGKTFCIECGPALGASEAGGSGMRSGAGGT